MRIADVWARAHAGKQKASVFSTPSDLALKAALAQSLFETSGATSTDYLLHLDVNPLDSLEGLLELQHNPEKFTFTMVHYMDLFEQLFCTIDGAAYPWKQRSLEWLTSRYGSTQIDCFSAGLITRLLAYVSERMLNDIEARNAELHNSASMLKRALHEIRICFYARAVTRLSFMWRRYTHFFTFETIANILKLFFI